MHPPSPMPTTLAPLSSAISSRSVASLRAAYDAAVSAEPRSPLAYALRALAAPLTVLERGGADLYPRPDGSAALVATPRSASNVERAWREAGNVLARIEG